MCSLIVAETLDAIRTEKVRSYRTIVLVSASAVLICAVVIVYFNRILANAMATGFSSQFETVIMTLVPYVVSAAVAAVAAIGVTAILPMTRLIEPSSRLVTSLRVVASGDLTVRLKLRTRDPLREVANELNTAVDVMGSRISRWKVLNRTQWGVLCRIRSAAEKGDCEDVLHCVDVMEQNWGKIAEIEQSLKA